MVWLGFKTQPLTLTLSHRERGLSPLSLWERVGVRVKQTKRTEP